MNNKAIKDGAHYCYCAHFLRMLRLSRATRKKCVIRRTRGLALCPVSLEGSSYFLWKRCVVFQQMKNNFYLPCQFFENRRSMLMLLFLPYDRSDRTFYSQTKINSKTSKVIASRCYTWSLGLKFCTFLCNFSPEDKFKAFEYIQMSLFLRVRGFYLLNKQEKSYHKIAWIAEIAASQTVADRKENSFIVEKDRKKLLCFLLLSLLFKHFGFTKH